MSIVVADLHLSVLSASHRGQYSVVVMCTCCAIRTPDNNSGNQSQLTAPGDYVADRNMTTLPIALPATNDGYNCFTFGSRDVSIGERNPIDLPKIQWNIQFNTTTHNPPIIVVRRLLTGNDRLLASSATHNRG